MTYADPLSGPGGGGSTWRRLVGGHPEPFTLPPDTDGTVAG